MVVAGVPARLGELFAIKTPEEDTVRLHRALWAMERCLELTLKTKWSLIKELNYV